MVIMSDMCLPKRTSDSASPLRLERLATKNIDVPKLLNWLTAPAFGVLFRVEAFES